MPALAEEMAIRENAPDRYVVKQGDTLWSIAGRFLQQPWRWPEIWGLNKEQIKNPNRIYPGDVIVLDRRGPSLALRPTVKVGPEVRFAEREREAIPSIPPKDIEPFLSKPLVIGAGELDPAPEIVGGRDERVVLGAGDAAYVRGLPEKDGAAWHIYRPGKQLTDPDSGEILGYEAIYLGEARVKETGEPSTVHIVRSTQEIFRGDRLLPIAETGFAEYLPHAPSAEVRGRVISVYGGVSEGGRNSVITLNRGARDGLERGHVLALYRGGEVIADPATEAARPRYNFLADGCLKPGKEVSVDKPYDPKDAYGPCPSEEEFLLRRPAERFGLAMVFRTFDRVSYALVVDASGPVKVLDHVRQP